MKSKLHLKKWVRVAITILTIIFGIFIYNQTGTLGELAQTNNNYLTLCLMAWIWLFIGQFCILSMVWE